MRRLPNGKVVVAEISYVELNGDGKMTVTPIWEPADDRTARVGNFSSIPKPIFEELVAAGFDQTLSDEVLG